MADRILMKIFSDDTGPCCRFSTRRIEQLTNAHDLEIKWIALSLRPETPEEVTPAELFAGRDVDIPSRLNRLKKAASDCGLPLGTREKTYNTRRAQEVGKWAEPGPREKNFTTPSSGPILSTDSTLPGSRFW